MKIDATARQEAPRLPEKAVELDRRVVDGYLLDVIFAHEEADRRDCWLAEVAAFLDIFRCILESTRIDH